MSKKNGGGEKANGNGKDPGHTKKEAFERNLRVILDGDQVAERSDRLAHLLSDRDNKVEMAKAAQKHAKSEIDELDATMRRLGTEVRDKACYLPVRCERLFDYRRGVVIETRTDTSEVIAERPMTPEERQMEFDPKKDGKGGDDDNLDDDFADDQPGA